LGFGWLAAVVDPFVSGAAMVVVVVPLWIVVLVTGVAHLSTSAARLRDIGLNPLFVLVGGVPLIGIALWVVLLGTPTKGRPGKTLLPTLAHELAPANVDLTEARPATAAQPLRARTISDPPEPPSPPDEREKTIQDLGEAIRLNPQDASAYYDRSAAYQKLGDFEQARLDYREAIGFDLQLGPAHYNKGAEYYKLGEYEKAVEQFTEAIHFGSLRLDPQYARSYYFRGVAYQQLGMDEEAARDFAKAKELGY